MESNHDSETGAIRSALHGRRGQLLKCRHMRMKTQSIHDSFRSAEQRGATQPESQEVKGGEVDKGWDEGAGGRWGSVGVGGAVSLSLGVVMGKAAKEGGLGGGKPKLQKNALPLAQQEVSVAPKQCMRPLSADSGPRGASRERLGAEGNLPQEKGGPSVPAHLLGNPYAFGLSPGAVMQDSRFHSLNLPRQMSNAVPPGHVPEEYLRGFRPYATTEDALRMSSLPLGLDPATAAAAAAYYHPSYLPHPSFTPYR
ncbi:Genetic suppressor element 1 [Liparis tanakae]|uniref:Genetic suppressor element 1 n=1 Tax=Liparis tanakae TaxID=230148 RepID=A0A4Z2IC56_9TELE|nr:Genetic suppressor element 1 [Liparis tanakae]